MDPTPERWSRFKRRALIVAAVAFAGEVLLILPLFPWPGLAEALPRTTPIDMLICACAVLMFAIGREYKISGDRRARWTVAQAICGLIVARTTLAALFDWLLRQQ